MMGIAPKKHHYVPQSVLTKFSIGGAGKQIYVFDKLEDRLWQSAIRDAGSENRFNTLEIDGEQISFEDAIQKRRQAAVDIAESILEGYLFAIDLKGIKPIFRSGVTDS